MHLITCTSIILKMKLQSVPTTMMLKKKGKTRKEKKPLKQCEH